MTATTAGPAVQSNRAGQEPAPNAQTPAGPQAARARAREATSKVGAATTEQVLRFTGTGVLDSTPSTIREVWRYTRAGGWIPGDRARWLEWFGKGYGFVVALPATAIAFTALWFVQRPTRVVLGVILWCALRWML